MHILISIFLIVVGFLNLFYPVEMINFKHIFVYKEGSEPTELAVFFARFGGLVAIISGIIFGLYTILN